MGSKYYMGNDGWKTISNFLEERAVKSVLLVTGRTAYTTSGAEKALEAVLQGMDVRRIFDFGTNPKVEDISRILASGITNDSYDVILAVGGGSVMDIGKLLKAFWESDCPMHDYIHGCKTITPSDMPLIAVPTTAGSGSEATHFAVIYDGEQKFSIGDQKLLPDLAVVIPSLLESLPRQVAASSGMDALCQGIESFWSIHSNETSQAFAKEAITLAWSSLRDAVLKNSQESLNLLARASYLSGKAINLTKTTAPHAVSYALTSIFGIPHGHAVGLLLPQFLKFNMDVVDADCLDPRGTNWVRDQLMIISNLLGCDDPIKASGALLKCIHEIGLETSISKLGVRTSEDMDRIVKNGFNPQRVNNNPRRLTEEALRVMLTEMINLRNS